MQQSFYSSPPVSPSMSRRPRRSLTATSAAVSAAALILAAFPSRVLATGRGLRIGQGVTEQPHQNNYIEFRGRELSPGEETAEGKTLASEEERNLAERDLGNDYEISTGPFKTDLLATNFPYPMKYESDNEISGAVSSFLALYLDEALEETVINLGLNCNKSKEKIGSELRFVLECSGAATFDAMPMQQKVNDSVRDAFQGESKHKFLEIMYPKYEAIHEYKQAEIEIRRRQPRGRGKKKKKKPKKKSGNKKKKNNNKPQMGQLSAEAKPSKTDIHNVNGSGMNVMGYVSGSQVNTGRDP